MKIHTVGGDLFHVDSRRTDRQTDMTETNRRLSQFCERT